MIFNVRAAVVELIEAETAEDAVKELNRRLHAAEFDVYEPEKTDAFESETLSLTR